LDPFAGRCTSAATLCTSPTIQISAKSELVIPHRSPVSARKPAIRSAQRFRSVCTGRRSGPARCLSPLNWALYQSPLDESAIAGRISGREASRQLLCPHSTDRASRDSNRLGVVFSDLLIAVVNSLIHRRIWRLLREVTPLFGGPPAFGLIPAAASLRRPRIS